MSNLKEEKRDRAKRLIELAFKNPESEEADNAAWRALKMIRKYKLLDLPPVDGVLDNDTVRAAKHVADVIMAPEFKDGLNVLGRFAGDMLTKVRRGK